MASGIPHLILGLASSQQVLQMRETEASGKERKGRMQATWRKGDVKSISLLHAFLHCFVASSVSKWHFLYTGPRLINSLFHAYNASIMHRLRTLRPVHVAEALRLVGLTASTPGSADRMVVSSLASLPSLLYVY